MNCQQFVQTSSRVGNGGGPPCVSGRRQGQSAVGMETRSEPASSFGLRLLLRFRRDGRPAWTDFINSRDSRNDSARRSACNIHVARGAVSCVARTVWQVCSARRGRQLSGGQRRRWRGGSAPGRRCS